MSTHTPFTPRHAKIFEWLTTVSPTNWQTKVRQNLGDGKDVGVLGSVLRMVLEQKEYLIGLTRELPPLHLLSRYFFMTGWDGSGMEDGATESIGATVFDPDTGQLDHLVLPGRNVEDAVRGLYRHLDAMIAMGQELEAEIKQKIEALPLFHDKGNAAPFKQIRALPSIVTRSQRLSIVKALEAGKGTTDLSALNKTLASFVLHYLEQAMLRDGKAIPPSHKRDIEIQCYQERYTWYAPGKKSKRARDWVKHHATSSNAHIPQEWEEWRDSI